MTTYGGRKIGKQYGGVLAHLPKGGVTGCQCCGCKCFANIDVSDATVVVAGGPDAVCNVSGTWTFTSKTTYITYCEWIWTIAHNVAGCDIGYGCNVRLYLQYCKTDGTWGARILKSGTCGCDIRFGTSVNDFSCSAAFTDVSAGVHCDDICKVFSAAFTLAGENLGTDCHLAVASISFKTKKAFQACGAFQNTPAFQTT